MQNIQRLLKHPLQILILMGIPVFAIYSNILHAPFIFDDARNIVNNPYIRMESLSWEGFVNAFQSLGSDRPFVMISFALNYYFGKYSPVGYHVVNISIHLINGFLLYLMAVRILNRIHEKKTASSVYTTAGGKFTALAASLIWLLHPVQIQSVTYITQRANSLSTLFVTLSLLCYLMGRDLSLPAGNDGSGQEQRPNQKGRRPVFWFTASGAMGFAAMGCKETAAILPFLILFFEWVLYQCCSVQWLKKEVTWIIPASIPGLVLYWLTVFQAAPENPITNAGHWDLLPVEKLLTESRVIVHYFSLLVYPHPSRLNLDYDFPHSSSLIDPITTLFSVLLIIFLVGLSISQMRRHRLLFLAIGWFFGNLVIESTIIPLDPIFQYRIYLPSMLVILAAVEHAGEAIRKRWLMGLALCLILGTCSLWTYQRNHVWTDKISLWSDNVKKSPEKARPRNNLALALAEKGHLEEAITNYRKALSIKPSFPEAYNNLGAALMAQNKPAEALKQYKIAVAQDPHYADALINIGYILFTQKNLKLAGRYYQEALKNEPNNHIAHYNLGNVYLLTNNLKMAGRHYQAAVTFNSEYASAYNNLAVVQEATGSTEDATRNYLAALTINPGHIDARENLKSILQAAGSIDKGIDKYHKVLNINPNSPAEKERWKSQLRIR
jgi:protein O-mannosyl-transferase